MSKTETRNELSISELDDFGLLFDLVERYFNGPKSIRLINFEGYFDHLRVEIAKIRGSGLWTDQELAKKFNISARTIHRYVRDGNRPSFVTFSRIMAALADDFGIDKFAESTKPSKTLANVTSQVGGFEVAPARDHKGREHSAIQELEHALEELVPRELWNPGMNRQPIELSQHHYDLLVATVRAADAYTAVKKWDQKVVRVIRSLDQILVEADILLQTAGSLVGKRLLKMLRGVAKGLRRLANAVEPKSDGE